MPDFQVILVLLCGAIGLVLGCTDLGRTSIPLEEKSYYSDVIVVGTVTEVIKPDPHFGEMQESAYGVRLDVVCVYKGGAEIPKSIEIVGAGYVAALCHSTNLTKGQDYLLFLDKVYQTQYYTPTFGELDTDAMLGEIIAVCDLKLHHPAGVTNDLLKETCEQPIQQDCFRYTPDVVTEATPETTSESEVTPEVSVEPKKGGQSTGDNGSNVNFLSCAVSLLSMALFLIVM